MANYVISEQIERCNASSMLGLRELALQDKQAAKKLFAVSEEFVEVVVSMTLDECKEIASSIKTPLFSPNKIDLDGWNVITEAIRQSKRSRSEMARLNSIIFSTMTRA